jgi:hypothetical protein
MSELCLKSITIIFQTQGSQRPTGKKAQGSQGKPPKGGRAQSCMTGSYPQALWKF